MRFKRKVLDWPWHIHMYSTNTNTSRFYRLTEIKVYSGWHKNVIWPSFCDEERLGIHSRCH